MTIISRTVQIAASDGSGTFSAYLTLPPGGQGAGEGDRAHQHVRRVGVADGDGGHHRPGGEADRLRLVCFRDDLGDGKFVEADAHSGRLPRLSDT